MKRTNTGEITENMSKVPKNEKNNETHNQKIANVLMQLADKYNYDKDKNLRFKAKALLNASVKISACADDLHSGAEAVSKAGVSERIGTKVQEILDTGTLSELGIAIVGVAENGEAQVVLPEDPETVAIKELCSVTGVGPRHAKDFFKQGISTVEQLRKAYQDGQVKLTHHMEVGLKWYDDLLERMPRCEVEALEEVLQKEIKKMNPNLTLVICGSYARGLQTCGDVDVLITNPSKRHEDLSKYDYLKTFVKNLTDIGFLIDHLTTSGQRKYMGVCQLNANSKGRRIDIRCVNYISFYPALIYFVGSKQFNIAIRKKALEKGYSLNEYFFTKLDTKENIAVHSEEELFKILDMEYVPPTER